MTLPKPSRPAVVGALVLAALVGLVVAAFLPGTFVPDTLDICAQAVTGEIDNWHAPVITALWRTFPVGPDLMLVVTVGAFVVACHRILRSSLGRTAAVVATVVVVLCPVTLGWLTTHGKDQWFAVGFLVTLACLSTARRTASSRRWWILVALAFVASWLTVASRSVSVVPLAALWISAPPLASEAAPAPRSRWLRSGWTESGWRRAVASLGVAAAVVVVCMGSQSLLNRLVIHPIPAHQDQATYQFDLAGLSIAAGRNLFPEGSLRPGADLDDIREHFRPEAGDAWFFGQGTPLVHPHPDPRVIEAQRRAWRDAVLDDPVAYARIRLEYTAALAGFVGHVSGVYDRGSDPERFGLRCDVPERRVPALHDVADDLLSGAARFPGFRGWVALGVLVLAAAVAGVRRSAEARSLLVGGLVSWGTFVAFGISPTFRYSWFTAVCALLCVALAVGRVIAWRRGGRDGGSGADGVDNYDPGAAGDLVEVGSPQLHDAPDPASAEPGGPSP